MLFSIFLVLINESRCPADDPVLFWGKGTPYFQDLVLVSNTEPPYWMDIGPGLVSISGKWSRWYPGPNGLWDKASAFSVTLRLGLDLLLGSFVLYTPSCDGILPSPIVYSCTSPLLAPLPYGSLWSLVTLTKPIKVAPPS